MRSAPKPRLEEPGTSLGDSTYEFLEDSLVLVSDDDDGHSESLAFMDSDSQDSSGHPVDLGSSGQGLTFTQVYAGRPAEGMGPASSVRPTSSDKPGHIVNSDGNTRVPSNSPSFIRHREDEGLSEGEAELCYEWELSLEETPAHLAALDAPGLRMTIRQTVSSETFAPSRPFRILYVGDVDHQAMDEILAKIASVLAAGRASRIDPVLEDHGPVRYNVVPLSSFGGAEAPDVELIDFSGLELVVDRCAPIAPLHTVKIDSHRTSRGVRVLLNGSQVVIDPRAGNDHLHADLAVFAHSNAAEAVGTTSKTTMSVLREAVESLAIPTLDIALEDWSYELPPVRFQPKSLRICIEACNAAGSDSHILASVPIDLGTFLAMDPVQLNRHFACIVRDAKISMSELSSVSGFYTQHTSSSGPKNTVHPESAIHPLYERVTRICSWRSLLILLILGLSMVLPLGGISPSSWSTRSVRVPDFDEEMPRTKLTPAPSILPAKQACTPKTNDDVVSSAFKTPDALVGDALPKASTGPIILELFGEKWTLPNSPLSIASLKELRNITLLFNLGATDHNSSVKKLPDGAYAVDLSQEDAHGELELKVRLDGEHAVVQNIELRTGTSWPRTFATWLTAPIKKATSWTDKDHKLSFAGVEDRLKPIFDTIWAEIDRTNRNVTAAVHHNAEHTLDAVRTYAEESFDRLSTRVRSSSRKLLTGASELRGRVYDRSSHFAGVRSPEMVAKARRNALRLGRKVAAENFDHLKQHVASLKQKDWW